MKQSKMDAQLYDMIRRNVVYMPVLESLLQAGADVETRPSGGDTPLMWAVSHRNAPAVTKLLSWGAKVDAFGASGENPLLWASWHGDTAIVQTLLAYGANPNVISKQGMTPLMDAGLCGWYDVVALLIEAGADTAAVTKQGTVDSVIAASGKTDDAMKSRLLKLLHETSAARTAQETRRRLHQMQEMTAGAKRPVKINVKRRF